MLRFVVIYIVSTNTFLWWQSNSRVAADWRRHCNHLTPFSERCNIIYWVHGGSLSAQSMPEVHICNIYLFLHEYYFLQCWPSLVQSAHNIVGADISCMQNTYWNTLHTSQTCNLDQKLVPFIHQCASNSTHRWPRKLDRRKIPKIWQGNAVDKRTS